MKCSLPVRSATLVFAAICIILFGTSISGSTWNRVVPREIDIAIGSNLPAQNQSVGRILDGVFTYQQQRSLSCEYASLHIATTMLGDPISEYAFDDLVPQSDNPHLGYRGSIVGEWGNTDDYGVYSGPLQKALQPVGFHGETFYGDSRRLRGELDLERPVIVWLGFWGESGSHDEYSADGRRFQLTPGMHVLVVYGYSESTVFLTDPGTAVLREYSWQEFERLWQVMDRMALSVYR